MSSDALGAVARMVISVLMFSNSCHYLVQEVNLNIFIYTFAGIKTQ